jgi:hypothetical protein
MTRKKGRKKKEDLNELYVIRFAGWCLNYSFSANKDRRWFGPLSDDSSLKIEGEFLWPEKVKGRRLIVSLVSSRGLDDLIEDPSKLEHDPVSIGSLTSRGGHSSYFGSVPFKAFPIIIGMLENRKSQGIVLHGTKLRYGEASIRSIAFVTEQELAEDYAYEGEKI